MMVGCPQTADPDLRPPIHSVMAHPLWWPSPQRLAFLIAVSDRVEGEDRAVSRGSIGSALQYTLHRPYWTSLLGMSGIHELM